MANNLFIAYELFRPEKGESHQRVREVIERLGAWAKIGTGMYYLHSDADAEYVGNKVWAALNMDDKLIVVNSTKNDARWYNIKPEVSDFLVKQWYA